MENLSEYIPILIILVSVIFTVLGKKKKPANVTQETTLPGQTAGEFIDESSFPQPFTGSNQKLIIEKPKKQTPRKPEVKLEIKPEKKIETFSSTSAPTIIEPEEEEHSAFSFEEDDDVARAIVYAEIINRKEY